MDPRDINYADMVRTLAKSGETIAAELTHLDRYQLELAVSLASTEVIDTIKRKAIYRKPLDTEKLRDQLRSIREFATDLEDTIDMIPEHIPPGAYPELTGDQAHYLHMSAGVGGEGAELMGAVAGSSLEGEEPDRDNLIEELGDLEFYMEGIRQGAGITREETLTANKVKLGKRYDGLKYSDQSAQERADKAG